ncbi:uncharacterized protein LOC129302296 [Prosopis cineraria]|uniref:uncharacterized protein LOC129302296 n=1 Tax=Prosopis cineraria TaxID=364024 RepID=UPI00240EF247|nr:uncharacterized protein LOC129302296 [Prosopis cineraria]
MARISSLVLVISLLVALPWRWAAGQDDPWKSLADQAASQGISQQSIDDAQAALRGGADDSESSVWADWIKGNANNMGYTDENAPTGSADGSPSDEPEAADFADIGVDESSPADAESPAEASPTYSPTYAPQPQAPALAAATPQAQAPEADAPEAYVPEAPTPEAYAPGAATPEAYAPGATTPEAQSTEATAPKLEAEAPGAVTSTVEAPVEAAAPGTTTSSAQAPGASSPGAA